MDSGAGVVVDCGERCGCNSAFLSSCTTSSASFCASAIPGVGTASGSGASVARVVEGANSGIGVILRRLDALSPSTVSSSLSRLKSRGFSVKEGGSVVGATERAGAVPLTVVVASDGATTTGDDGKGEEVDGGGCNAVRGVVVSFLTAAAPHVHFSRSVTKYTSAFSAYAW